MVGQECEQIIIKQVSMHACMQVSSQCDLCIPEEKRQRVEQQKEPLPIRRTLGFQEPVVEQPANREQNGHDEEAIELDILSAHRVHIKY